MVNRSILVAFAVAFMVATAGCAAITGGGEDPVDNSTDPVDGGDTPSGDTPSVDDFEYPEFANSESIQSEPFYIHNSERFQSTSLTVTSSDNSASNELSFESERVAQFGDDGNALIERSSNNRTVEMFGPSGSTGFSRTPTEEGYTYSDSRIVSPESATKLFMVGEIVANSDAQAVETTTIGGETVVKYEFDNYDIGSLTDSLAYDAIQIINMELYLNSNGTIVQHQIEVDNVQGGERYSDAFTTTISDIGDTTVSEPAWYSTAEDSAVIFEATFMNNGVVELELTQGSFQSGVDLFVGTPTGFSQITLDDDLNEGDSVYAYQRGSDVTITTSEPNESGDDISNVFIGIDSNGSVLYEGSFNDN